MNHLTSGSDLSSVYHAPGMAAQLESGQADASGQASYFCDRIRRLGRVIDGTSVDRELAMFRAHQHGMTPEQIAAVVICDPAEVRHTITVLSREEDIDEWDDGPDWIEFYPNHGWHLSS